MMLTTRIIHMRDGLDGWHLSFSWVNLPISSMVSQIPIEKAMVLYNNLY